MYMAAVYMRRTRSYKYRWDLVNATLENTEHRAGKCVAGGKRASERAEQQQDERDIDDAATEERSR